MVFINLFYGISATLFLAGAALVLRPYADGAEQAVEVLKQFGPH